MGRLSSILILAFSFIPGVASAATFSAFSVHAIAQISLVSATFTDTGADALGSLDIVHSIDLFDDFPEQSGNAIVGTDFTHEFATGYASAATSGSAAGPFGSAKGDVQGRVNQNITNTSNAEIELVFSYSGSFNAGAVGFSADYLVHAFVQLQDDGGEVFYAETPLFTSSPQSFSGQTSILFGAGETIYAASYAEAFGTAFAFDPAPVTLPASLPFLLGALGGLAVWRRRHA